jgi:hypothetical protein
MCANYIIQQCTAAFEWTGKQRCGDIRASFRRGTESGGNLRLDWTVREWSNFQTDQQKSFKIYSFTPKLFNLTGQLIFFLH